MPTRARFNPLLIFRILGALVSIALVGCSVIMADVYPFLTTFLPLLLVAVAGYLATWIHPHTGGWAMLVASLLMTLWLEQFFGDHRAALIFGIPFLLLGLAFILSKQTSGRTKGQ